MLKSIKKFGLLVAAIAFLGSCAPISSPVIGSIYTDVKAPMAVTSNANSTKVGTSEATSILGLVATGDASIDTAAKSAGITKIHHVDVEAFSVLGAYCRYTVFVYGE